ncbi:MAG: aldose epimerase family protein [Planctomycetota bacterium]
MSSTLFQAAACLLLAVLLASCSATSSTGIGPLAVQRVVAKDFGRLADGRQAQLYVLRNARGTEAQLTDFGATLVAMRVPDRTGSVADVVLGFDDVAGYKGSTNQYFGCTTGRVANRIALGRFELDGETFELAANNEPNHLHGGVVGLGQRLWAAAPSSTSSAITFTYMSPDGEEGYPGNLRVSITYSLTEDDELVLDYRAETDAATPVNLTHHSYFNLAGAGSATVLDHRLTIAAGRFTPTDETLIPTGTIESIEGTPLDFRKARSIGERIASLDDTPSTGYDHNYAVRDKALATTFEAVIGAGPVAVLEDPSSGRVLEIYSDQPGLQLYSGNFLDGQAGKGGAVYPRRSAVCLETQGYPDAINQPRFPNTILRPGETYRQLTVHRFRAE